MTEYNSRFRISYLSSYLEFGFEFRKYKLHLIHVVRGLNFDDVDWYSECSFIIFRLTMSKTRF